MSQRGVWSSLIKGTSFEEIAQVYCKNTDAAPLWGYTPPQNIYGILKSLHTQPLIMKGIGLLYIRTTLVNLNTIRILKRNQITY